MSTSWLGVVLAAACVVASGCEKAEGGGSLSLGHEGRVGFGYDRSCFFECPIEQPLLVGTRERVIVDEAGDAEGIEASTRDTDVVEVVLERDCFCEREDGNPGRLEIEDGASCASPWRKNCDNEVVVEAKAVGEALLELRDENGSLVDSIDLVVREADHAAFFATYSDRLGTMQTEEVTLAAGEGVEVEVELYDADGLVLLAPEGVLWRSDDDAVAVVTAWLVGSGAEVDAGLGVTVEAKAAGATDVHVVVPGLDAALAVTVEN